MKMDKIKKYVAAFALLGIVLMGFQMRMRSITDTVVDSPIRADAKDYIFYAYNMKYSHMYSRDYPNSAKLHPDAVRTPGYPVFLSAFLDRDISDSSLRSILFAQAILSSVTILLAYLIFCTLFENKIVPLVVAFLVAISPHLITANVYFLSETVFCFLLLLSIFLLSFPKIKSSLTIALLFGIALAAAALTRPWLNYFMILLGSFLMLPKFKFLKKKAVVCMVVGFLALMSVWTIRNLITLGSMSDNRLTINMLHHGMYPYFMYDYQPKSYGFPYRFDPHSEQIARSVSSVLTEIAHRFTNSPLEYFGWYLLGKPIELFAWNNNAQGSGDVFIYPVRRNPYFNQELFQITHRFMKAVYPLIIFFFALALILVWLPAEKLGVSDTAAFLGRCVALLFFYFTMVHCIGAPFPRYAIPMLPLMYGMAVFAISILIKAGKNTVAHRLAHE